MQHVPLTFHCIYGCSDEGVEDGDGKEGGEDLRARIGWFVDV